MIRGDESAMNYNRDNLGKPLEDLSYMLDMTRRGLFVPDAARGSRKLEAGDPRVIDLLDAFENDLGVSLDQLIERAKGTRAPAGEQLSADTLNDGSEQSFQHAGLDEEQDGGEATPVPMACPSSASAPL